MFAPLLVLLACSPSVTTPAPNEPKGVVLYVDDALLLVQHDEVQGRLAPGTAMYRLPPLSEGVDVGDTVVITASAPGFAATISETGRGDLPASTSSGPHPLTGVVVRVDDERVTIDHDAIPGVMASMVMTFVMLPEQLESISPGDKVSGTLVGSDFGFRLVRIDKTGTGSAALREDVKPLEVGESFPRIEVALPDGDPIVLGVGQDKPTALTFLYTTCPDPAFCPALAARLQALQPRIAGKARIVAITIDPEVDQPHVLRRYANTVAADPDTWVFGRLEPEWLQRAALLSGIAVTQRSGRISHNVRVLLLDKTGTVLARYDDADWPMGEVVDHLLTD
jgi:protein SCO1/2